jgi:DNA-binding PadR family transcriptional regulator
MLGEFEYLVLCAVERLGDDAYGAAVRELIQAELGRACSIGALYTTVDRLEGKGFVRTWMGEATPERGGRQKRMIRLTREGATEAAAFYAAVARASRGLTWARAKGGG